MKKRELTVEAFAEWLDALPPYEAFERGNCRECPLAKYLGPRSIVTVSYFMRRGKASMPLPKWAQDFVLEFDSGRGKITGPKAVKNALVRATR